MAQMRLVVDGGAAAVPGDGVAVCGDEQILLLGQRVSQMQLRSRLCSRAQPERLGDCCHSAETRDNFVEIQVKRKSVNVALI